jgi:hypothetical protein
MSNGKEPVSGCHGCGVNLASYAVVRWIDLAFWCTTECWARETREVSLKAAEKRRFLQGGNRVAYGVGAP